MTPEQQAAVDSVRAALTGSQKRAAELGYIYEVGYLRNRVQELIDLIDELAREGGGQ